MANLNIISTDNLTSETVRTLIDESQKFVLNKVERKQLSDTPFTIGCLFEQKSHRTKHCFMAAGMRLGLNVLDFSQAYREELLDRGGNQNDFMDLIGELTSCLVVRSENENLVHTLSQQLPVPIINAGNGRDEHPTQALADISFIKSKRANLSNLKVAMIGSLRDSRCANSLSALLGMFNAEIMMVCPKELVLKPAISLRAEQLGGAVDWSEELSSACNCDVIYFTGALEEDFATKDDYKTYHKWFDFPRTLANDLKSSAFVMHPLPRGAETDAFRNTGFDVDVKGQAKHGLAMRMAILKNIRQAYALKQSENSL